MASARRYFLVPAGVDRDADIVWMVRLPVETLSSVDNAIAPLGVQPEFPYRAFGPASATTATVRPARVVRRPAVRARQIGPLLAARAAADGARQALNPVSEHRITGSMATRSGVNAARATWPTTTDARP